jgi:thioredoxin 1
MQELRETEFESRTSKGVVLLDFGAEWCGPCKTMLPILDRFSKAYEGKVAVYSIDIDRDPGLAARHGIMSVPTMLVLREGKMVERMVGVVSESELKKRIDPFLGA